MICGAVTVIPPECLLVLVVDIGMKDVHRQGWKKQRVFTNEDLKRIWKLPMQASDAKDDREGHSK
jgi:hypothetical protein